MLPVSGFSDAYTHIALAAKTVVDYEASRSIRGCVSPDALRKERAIPVRTRKGIAQNDMAALKLTPSA
ncbi:MAG: hypothetical protein JW990_07650, partial [Thermoleophilia bacterium]|nr:hypothetical protein [Thermoleophilia bacterium]